MAPVAVAPKYCLNRKDMLWPEGGREKERDEEKVVMNAPILNPKVNASMKILGRLVKQLRTVEKGLGEHFLRSHIGYLNYK